MEERSLDQLADEIAALAADIQAAMCRWLGLVAEFDRREGWAVQGFRRCADWVSWRCGIGPEAAREHVRVARRLEELPLVRAAFARADLSYSKVRALTRVEGIEREEDLVELAGHATAAQLERLVRSYRRVVATEEGAREQLESRHLHLDWDEHNCLRIRGRLPAEQGALLLKAIESVWEKVGENVSAETHGEDLPPFAGPAETAAARRADALVHLADNALAASAASVSAAGSSGGDRFQVVVHVDAATLTGDDAAGRSHIAEGPALPQEVARRLACDASVVRVIERDGKPLSVGRKSRTIPPALRRALRSRDGGCQFPGCNQSRHVDAHHVHHWAHGGGTDLTNLVELCRHHHRLVHEGAFSISGRPGALVFTTPSGRRLHPVPRRNRDACNLHRVSAETRDQPYERMDLGLAVDAMLAFAPPPNPASGGVTLHRRT